MFQPRRLQSRCRIDFLRWSREVNIYPATRTAIGESAYGKSCDKNSGIKVYHESNDRQTRKNEIFLPPRCPVPDVIMPF